MLRGSRILRGPARSMALRQKFSHSRMLCSTPILRSSVKVETPPSLIESPYKSKGAGYDYTSTREIDPKIPHYPLRREIIRMNFDINELYYQFADLRQNLGKDDAFEYSKPRIQIYGCSIYNRNTNGNIVSEVTKVSSETKHQIQDFMKKKIYVYEEQMKKVNAAYEVEKCKLDISAAECYTRDIANLEHTIIEMKRTLKLLEFVKTHASLMTLFLKK